MKMEFMNFKIESEFKGDKLSNWSDNKYKNYNNHIIKVYNKITKKRTSFEFWESIAQVKIETEDQLLNAFECFVNDAISGNQNESFEEFCQEFGYDNDSRQAEKIYKACQKLYEKLNKISDIDIYDLYEALQIEQENI